MYNMPRLVHFYLLYTEMCLLHWLSAIVNEFHIIIIIVTSVKPVVMVIHWMCLKHTSIYTCIRISVDITNNKNFLHSVPSLSRPTNTPISNIIISEIDCLKIIISVQIMLVISTKYHKTVFCCSCNIVE